MVRLGRRAGFAGLLVFSWLAGCTNAEDASDAATSGPSAGGGAPSFGALEQDVGRVLVVGESEKVRYFEREYRGLAERDHTTDDLVRCDLTSRDDGFVVSIEAAQGSSSTLQFAAQWLAPSLGPVTFEVRPSEADENTVRVRLGDGNAVKYYEYGLDGSEDPNSLCSVGFTTFDRDQIVGKAACRRLLATGSSLDATAEGGDLGTGPGTASATFEFSCPFHDVVGSGGGGKSGTGMGGAGTNGRGGGGGHANSAAGTTGNSGGTTGDVVKHCVGVTTPCSLRDSISCEQSNGCTFDEDCSGVSSSCYGQIGVYACTAIQGCVWASSSQSCIGSAWSCSSFSGSLGCGNQPGCDWHAECSGVAPLCSTLGEFTCALESGCRWE
jgi:hypothetical protein